MSKTNPDPTLRDQAIRSRKSVFTILIIEDKDDAISCASGTGFVIKASEGKCIVLTCKHVVSDFKKPRVAIYIRRIKNEGVEQLLAKVVYMDKYEDIAILEVEGLTDHISALTFSSDTPPVGAKVIAVGYCNPEDLFDDDLTYARLPVISPGEVRGKLDRDGRRAQVLDTTFVGMPGMSGSPVLCRGGGVSGVVEGGNHRWTSVITARTVRRALKRWLRIRNRATIQEVIERIPM